MATFAPTTFLGFLVNSITGEHFIAAAEGSNPREAEASLRETYPSAAYQILTIYQAQAVQNYLNDAQRWPTLPSRVQPKLADLLATQRIRTQVGGLPPLKKAAVTPAHPHLNAAQIQQIKTIAQGMPAETQAMAARLLVGSVAPLAAKPMTAPARTPPQPQVQPKVQAPPQPTVQAKLEARIDVSATPTPKGGNIKEALAAMRAFNTPNQPSAYAQAFASPAAPIAAPNLAAMPITRTPQPGTAALSPAALPPSARGVAQDDDTPAPASPFAVGKVSAISVLKALRSAR
jgi:hypothetical protein